MIFVAQPYYSPNQAIVKLRTKLGALYCGALLKQGVMCVSPVAYGTTILSYADLPSDFSFWDKISFALLEKCIEIHVLTIDGWKQSRGVKAEIGKAKELGIPITYITPDQLYGEIYKSKITINTQDNLNNII